MDHALAGYALSFAIALGILGLALLLVVVMNSLSQRGKLVGLGVIFFGAISVNYLTARGDDSSFRATLSQVLEWTYASLTMFAGQGSLDTVRELATPGNLPPTGLELVAYFFQVLAFLVAIAAIVNALAHQFASRVALRITPRRGLSVVHGNSPDALLMVENLAAARDRGTAVVLVPSDAVPEDVPKGVRVLPDGPRTRQALVKAAQSTRGPCRFFHFDDGRPDHGTRCIRWLAWVDTIRTDVQAHAFLRSDWTRDKVALPRTNHDVKTFDMHEMVARDLVRVAAPLTTMGPLSRGRTSRPFTAFVVGSPRLGLERILQTLVMNAQILATRAVTDPRPRFVVVADAPMAGDFHSRFPEADLSGNFTFTDAATGSEEFWGALRACQPHLVVVALPDATDSADLAERIRHDHLVRGVPLDDGFPTIAVHGTAPQADDTLCWFGGRDRLYTTEMVLDGAGDKLAREINRRYAEQYRRDGETLASADDMWKELTYLQRVSSRASADFNSSMLTIKESMHDSSDKERLDLLGETEHLRWNAFYRMRGFSRMPPERWQSRISDTTFAPDVTDPIRRAKEARTDDVRKQHLCLVEWEELPEIDALTLRALAPAPPPARPDHTPFQDVDRKVVVLESLDKEETHP